MPFPLPKNSKYRKEIVWAWIEDISDRIEQNAPGAEISWKIANEIYLSLDPGEGDSEIESALNLARVKLDQTHHT